MALKIDINSNKITAEIQIDERIEKFDCSIAACENPICTCGTVYLKLTHIQHNDQTHSGFKCQVIKIDMYEKSLEYSQDDEVSSDELKFAEKVLSNLNDDDYAILHEKHFKYKNKISEEASPDSIETQFDYEEVEYNGLMYFYNDVLPYGERLVTTVNGVQYEIHDQYCLLPKCSCSDVHLSFMSINSDGVLKDESCDVSVNYIKNQWETANNCQTFADIGSIRSSIEHQIPNVYNLFKTRHLKLKSIYAHCKKRDYNSQIVSLSPKVGRNDPCPCGSGKKFKKCCLGK